MGISIRAYARYRGVSHTAVHKAIKAGRITLEEDGTLDPEKADQQWQKNTNPIRQGLMHKEDMTISQSHRPDHSLEYDKYVKARGDNEVLKVKIKELQLREAKKELIDKEKALAQIFSFSRTLRNLWLDWPAQIVPELASTFKIDMHQLQASLESLVKVQLKKISELPCELDP